MYFGFDAAKCNNPFAAFIGVISESLRFQEGAFDRDYAKTTTFFIGCW